MQPCGLARCRAHQQVSLSDLAEFQRCYSGSSVVAKPPCRGFDHDADGDVDLADFMRFRIDLEGP